MWLSRLFVALGLICSLPLGGSAEDTGGEVKIPLPEYQRLIEASRATPKPERQVPTSYAIGPATVAVEVAERATLSAKVDVNVTLKIFESQWTFVPLLPSNVAVELAAVGGSAIELVSTPEGLGFSSKEAGSYNLHLAYTVDVHRSTAGYSLAIPLPKAASSKLTASLPAALHDLAVIPSAGTETKVSDGKTSLTAMIPAASGIQLTWKTEALGGYTISRATYKGKLNGDAVNWTSEYELEAGSDEALSIPLLPQSVILSDLRIDGKRATIRSEERRFGTTIKGKGTHTIALDFVTPVSRESGAPQISLPLLEVPVSRVDLTLDGDKEVSLIPASHVDRKSSNGETVATAFIPLARQVTMSWNDAIPEETKAELNAQATIYHAVVAEEGVLSVHAIADYEISRGSATSFEFEVPKGVQMNKVLVPAGGLADWRLVRGENTQKSDSVKVFLDREAKEALKIELYYERPLAKGSADEKISVPMLRAVNVRRQRGMVALLASKELSLKPVETQELTHVGENQLPAEVRQAITNTVAHTFKYTDASAVLMVQTTTPEKREGKFDATVNTLVSLSDVTLKGSATIEMNVKSGAIGEVQLELPTRVNLLSLTAPSLRIYKAQVDGDKQLVDVQFTQDMEGQFPIEVNYELIMEEKETQPHVPTILVRGAEIEQGRIAVEALSAVEVRPAETKQLSSLDLSELPQQLILKTTNPILLAYKYVHAEPKYDLALSITRHREVEVQSAAIDTASYRTLYTRDGVAVTAASFLVRNTRSQFLRVALPADSKVWSVLVNGAPEKPALAESPDGKDDPHAGQNLLIKIINSAQGFPVDVVYQTAVDKLGTIGTVRGALARPDMVVTNSRWDVYLPEQFSYGRVRGTMEVVEDGVYTPREVIQAEVSKGVSGVPQRDLHLQLAVPTAGIRFSFQKLYANQSDEEATFSVAYSSGSGRFVSYALLVAGTLLLWLGILGPSFLGVSRQVAQGAGAAGVGILVVIVGYYGVSAWPVWVTSVLVAAFPLVREIIRRRTREKTQGDAAVQVE